jgi:hypothetical protein
MGGSRGLTPSSRFAFRRTTSTTGGSSRPLISCSPAKEATPRNIAFALAYRVQDGQVHVLASVAERKGIQPVIHLMVNGAESAKVAAGQTVILTAQIEVPPAPGKVVSANWDFEGVGSYPDAAELGDATSQTIHVTATHAFSKSGTYFPALRVASQREGNPRTPFARSRNLGRVRVVVSE